VSLRECCMDDPLADTPEKIVAFWRAQIETTHWYRSDAECFCIIMLNSRRRIIGYNLVSIGTLNTILVHPREVFRVAIIAAADAIVLAHNHPSGDPEPSRNDIQVTHDLVRAGSLLKLEVLDHIILGKCCESFSKGYVSLRELGFLYPPVNSRTSRRKSKGPMRKRRTGHSFKEPNGALVTVTR